MAPVLPLPGVRNSRIEPTVKERGKALGLNQVAALGGSFIGLILGGILSVFDWRYVFLVLVQVFHY